MPGRMDHACCFQKLVSVFHHHLFFLLYNNNVDNCSTHSLLYAHLNHSHFTFFSMHACFDFFFCYFQSEEFSKQVSQFLKEEFYCKYYQECVTYACLLLADRLTLFDSKHINNHRQRDLNLYMHTIHKYMCIYW